MRESEQTPKRLFSSLYLSNKAWINSPIWSSSGLDLEEYFLVPSGQWRASHIAISELESPSFVHIFRSRSFSRWQSIALLASSKLRNGPPSSGYVWKNPPRSTLMKNWWFQPAGFRAKMGGVSEWVTSSAHVEEASLDDNISGCNGVGCSGEEALVIDSSVVVSSSSFEARTFGSLSSCLKWKRKREIVMQKKQSGFKSKEIRKRQAT